MSQLFGIAFWTCLVVYALSVALLIHALAFASEERLRIARWGVAAGLLLHTVLVAWRWALVGHVPAIGRSRDTAGINHADEIPHFFEPIHCS